MPRTRRSSSGSTARPPARACGAWWAPSWSTRAARCSCSAAPPHVRLFPGCWDIVGGHVEEGETLCAALAREIEEETGWRLVRVDGMVDVFDWDGGDGERRREIDVLATVEGDLTRPAIEREKFVEARWLDEAALRVLAASSTDSGMIDLALRALAGRPAGDPAPPS
ncbi:hypothetical protein GCM10017559_29880 [Streptosporangium longisporum]|uniref:Nudix hydrolase domain-containing protein n=1 Tax=Streptosporangium longisporum TaxID=46187 RepID=A0ABN3XXE8_9ACTN